MYNENQPLKSFLYLYNQFELFLTSIIKDQNRINSPFIIFMIHAYNVFMEKNEPFKKKDLKNEKYVSIATFYRHFDYAIDEKIIVEVEKNKFELAHELPYHLKLIKEEVII